MTPEQLKKALEYNAKEHEDGDLTPEMVVRLVEYWQDSHQLTDDGQCGPMSQQSIETSMDLEWAHGIDIIHSVSGEEPFVDGKWLTWDGPLKQQPTNYATAKRFFGDPETATGSNKLSKSWYKKNIIECHERLGNRLPGVPAKWWVKIHRSVEPYLREGLRRALISAPDFSFSRLGGFVFRHIRHDPSRPLSMHSLGCAVDIDPKSNRGIQFKRGKSPKAWSPEYYRYWPDGVPEAFVQAMSSCGFAWGNDWDEDGSTDDHTWLDPMHFEFIARDGHRFGV